MSGLCEDEIMLGDLCTIYTLHSGPQHHLRPQKREKNFHPPLFINRKVETCAVDSL